MRDDQFYLDGLRDGRLLVRVCDSCGRGAFPPMPGCPHCGNEHAHIVESAGAGSLYSWTECHIAFAPELAPEVPYIVGVVELPERARIVARIEGIDAGLLQPGMQMVATFGRVDGEGQPALTFVPSTDGAAA